MNGYPLVEYCTRLGPAGEGVGNALNWVATNWNQLVPTREGKERRLLDHGVLSAARLLHLLKVPSVSKEVEVIIMQAASAMALHNAVQMKELFPAAELSRLEEVPFSLFPVAAVLALCDTFQIWDRELNETAIPNSQDPVTTIEWVKRAFITASRVVRFDWKLSSTEEGKWLGDVHIKYSLQHGEHSKEVCNSLNASITRWITSGRGKAMSKLFSLGQVAGVRVSYWIPGSDNPSEAEF